MGAFYLSRRSPDSESLKAGAAETLKTQGFREIKDLSNERFEILYCRKINGGEDNIYKADADNFCLTTGTLIYRKRIGPVAAKLLLHDFANEQLDCRELFGNFAIVLCTQGLIRLFTDPQGVYPVWHDPEQKIFSSSFPVMFTQLPKLTVNSEAVYQQVFQEATFGGDTLFKEIHRLKVKTAVSLGDQCERIPALQVPTHSDCGDNMDDFLDCTHENLRREFAAVAECFGENIDSALSGGYDSRLLLALLREQGVTPHLHVYGKPDAADVCVAKNICSNEKIALSHEDKSAYPRITPSEFKDIVRQNFHAFQGSCADGLLDNGSDLQTRLSRTRNGRLQLNGGGGEVMRNFFYLSDRRYTVRELLWTFYSRFAPSTCTHRFNESRYYDNFEHQIRELTGIAKGKLDREMVEYLYAGFRCTYWMGQNNAINNQFGWFLTPFVDANISQDAHRIPIKLKNHGFFQAALINKISPALASYPSDYGHTFAEPVPLKRKLKDLATLLRPPWLRKFLYRIHKRSRTDWPYYLENDYLETILPNGFEYMSQFFRLDQVDDAEQFKRICSIEYLLQQVDAKLD